MTSDTDAALLADNDPPPVAIINPMGESSFLLIGDHAGNLVPGRLESLGLSPAELARHIGWDIGIGTLGTMLADALDAPFVRQAYSRLVIDCNRGPDAADAIAPVSDGTIVPGNADLSAADRAARFAAIHEPYQGAIDAALAARAAAGTATMLVALHSFTPAMRGIDRPPARPWHVGILHDSGDTRLAHAMLAALRADPALVVGDNAPYRMDGIDYTVPRHAYPRALPYVEIEVRQDLIADDRGCARWSALLARTLTIAAGNIAKGG